MVPTQIEGQQAPAPEIKVEKINEFQGTDLQDLCEAAESTLLENTLSFSTGMKRTEPPSRQKLENYWKGVLLVGERDLIVGRIDGVIAAAIQLLRPSASNQTQAFSAMLDHHFVAPWARGHGLAKMLIQAAEEEAKKVGLSVIRLSVRATLEDANKMYQSCGYTCWGTLECYEVVDGQMIPGNFYYKKI